MTVENLTKEQSLIDFIKDNALAFISLCGTLSILFSIAYHFGYFWAIDYTLLSYFSISDYISSGISFSLPVVLVMGLFELDDYYRNVFPSKREQRKNKEIDDLIKNNQHDIVVTKLKSTLKKLNRRLTIALSVFAVLLFIFWILFSYPNYGSLIIYILIFIGSIRVSKLHFHLRKKFERKILDTLFSLFLFVIISILAGNFSGTGALLTPPDSTITFSKDGQIEKKKVYILRELSEVIIFTDKKEIVALNR